MYLFKDKNIKIHKTNASKVIGISRVYLTDIMNQRKLCSKIVAYCITKYLDSEAEIEDYFVRKEK